VGRWRSGAVRDVLLRLAIGPVRHGAFVRRAKSAVGRALGDAGLIAKALNGVGFGLSANGQPARAIAAHNEEAVVARSINDGDSLRFALNAIGKAHRGLNDLADAEMYYEQAIAVAREHGNVCRCAIALGNLADVLLASGKLDRARAALVESAALSRMQGGKGAVECQGDIVAALAAASADHSIAARFHGAVTARMQESGNHHEPAYDAHIAGWMARSRKAIGAAAFDAAEAEGKALKYEAALVKMERWLHDGG